MPRTGRDVVRGAAEGLRELGVDVLLAHAEVGELDVALPGQHHVVQLQVTVHCHHQLFIIFCCVCYCAMVAKVYLSHSRAETERRG